jgi:hypothetical protein
LQQEYRAGDPTFWLRVPEPFLTPFVQMMPRLQAERQQRLIDALVLANGRQAKDGTYREHVAALQSQAAGSMPTRRRAVKATSLDAISHVGIRVTREDRVAVSSVTTLKPGTRPGLKQKAG